MTDTRPHCIKCQTTVLAQLRPLGGGRHICKYPATCEKRYRERNETTEAEAGSGE